MAVKANATITLSFMVDVKAVYRYYKLQASTASAPSVPTTATPSGWTDSEPTYTEGSTQTLYTVDKTVFTNDSFVYSLVSKSTAYEAAKAAYNKAVAANTAANNAQNAVDNLEIGGRNLIQYTDTNKNVISKWNIWGCASIERYNNWIKCSYNNTSGSNYGVRTPYSFNLESGQTYTLSFDAYATKQMTLNYCYVMSSGGNVSLASLVDFTATTSTQHFEVTFTKSVDRTNCGILIGTADSNALVDGTAFYVRNVKLEKGNKATDWTPAPEDVEATINDLSLSVTTNQQEMRLDFTNAVASASNDLQSQMTANNNATNQKFGEIDKYIRFVDGKIILGESGNELMLTIQNNRVSFTQSGVEVAYFSKNNLYINRAQVLTTLKVGNYEFTPRNDGGMALRKRSV